MDIDQFSVTVIQPMLAFIWIWGYIEINCQPVTEDNTDNDLMNEFISNYFKGDLPSISVVKSLILDNHNISDIEDSSLSAP